MDARLHHLQRETEFVTSQATALALIEEFHREKLAAMIQHMSHARLVWHNKTSIATTRPAVVAVKAITELGGAEPASRDNRIDCLRAGVSS